MAKKGDDGDRGRYVWALLRIGLGLIFLWAFFDKLIGLGFATCKDSSGSVVTMCSKAWINGGQPTKGFLMGAKGPFESIFHSLAGNTFVDFLFMTGLLLIGLALIAGIGVRIATGAGSLLMFLMWLAVLPPAQNPVLDDHIIYILVLCGVYITNSKQVWGLRNWWVKQDIVKQYPVLE